MLTEEEIAYYGARLKPKKKPEPPKAKVVPFNPWPVQRRWTPFPTGTTCALPYEPSFEERMEDARRVNAEAARRARRAADPVGLGLYGYDSE